MSNSTLYDADILLWSERQAAAIRRLARSTRDVPNELDIENVAEEIESVGRSELAAVESYLERMLVYLIRLLVEPGTASARHWRSEIAAFHSNARRRYSPSMRQRIDLDALWRSAREQSLLSYEGRQQQLVAELPRTAPFAIDDLLAGPMDVLGLEDRLQGEMGRKNPA
ncbi:MAG: DUF29 domain-containing protein [Hyphomicrobiales bacterium]|nr:DUF29 domain-containing protein [Hyphomicrobiales bacterium]